MTFRYFFPLVKQNFRAKGRRDGRLSTAEFNRFVRRPYRERALQSSFQPKGNRYNSIDCKKLQEDSLQRFRQFNSSHMPLQQLKREIKREFIGKGTTTFLPRR